ncbi:hypothetical protein [Acidithiobacillus sp.]
MADRITLLGQQSGRAYFDCGNALNDFLQRHAGQQQAGVWARRMWHNGMTFLTFWVLLP